MTENASAPVCRSRCLAGVGNSPVSQCHSRSPPCTKYTARMTASTAPMMISPAIRTPVTAPVVICCSRCVSHCLAWASSCSSSTPK